MRTRILSLSLAIFVMASISSNRASAAASDITICDEAGVCGSCCTVGIDCQDWCASSCDDTICTTTANEMCCGAGGSSIECGFRT